MKKIKIIFMSNAEFGVPAFQKIAENPEFEISSLITIPDKQKGRHLGISLSPIKNAAQKYNIPILETENIKDEKWEKTIRDQNPDVIVVASFGQIIPETLINIPKHKMLNIHPSLLPRYRGPSPIQYAILNGDKTTGVTIMLVDKEMDHGDILGTWNLEIENWEPAYKELHDKLANIGADLIVKLIPDWIAGKIKPVVQDHSKATYTKKISKEDGHIDWNEPAEVIKRKIRAYNPWPGAYSFYEKLPSKKVRLIFLKARISECLGVKLPSSLRSLTPGLNFGEIFKTNDGFGVQTGKGVLEIKSLKPEGKKEMEASDFLRGNIDIIGKMLA